MPGVGIVADFFHMNIEEADIGAALEQGMERERLLEVHLADSNRRGLGQGHLPLGSLLSILSGFDGSVVMEFIADADTAVEDSLGESATFIRKALR